MLPGADIDIIRATGENSVDGTRQWLGKELVIKDVGEKPFMSNEGNIKLPYDYDMHDNDAEIPSAEPLKEALVYCKDNILEAYRKYDSSALLNQKYHRLLAVIASVCGTIAVLFAIMQLSGFFLTSWPMWVEIGAATIAFLAVMAGLIWSQQAKWLLNRHKAERYRMLKFLSIIHPDLWMNNIGRWKDKFTHKIKEIEQMTPRLLRDWAEGDRLSEMPLLEKCVFDETTIRALVDYYLDKRLEIQKTYFKSREMRNEKLDHYTRNLPYLLYFLSVMAVFWQFIVDIFSSHSHGMHSASVMLIILAASFPVLAAGIRTLRSTYEFARSAALFQAKYAALDRMFVTITDEIKQLPINKETILTNLWQCEQFLKAEHREWLRLMMEADWFI